MAVTCEASPYQILDQDDEEAFVVQELRTLAMPYIQQESLERFSLPVERRLILAQGRILLMLGACHGR